MTGAERIVQSMKKINNSNKQIPSEICSLTVISTNPLIFQNENRIQITSDFYDLSNVETWSTLKVGNVVKGFTFNEGQKYYIQQKVETKDYTIESLNAQVKTNVKNIGINADDISRIIGGSVHISYTPPSGSSITGTSIDQALTQVINNTETTVPIGSGFEYYGTTAPNNYMFADGSAISRTEYSELFAVIGTIYGKGDGSTTFNLPSLARRVPIGYESEDEGFNELGKKGGSFWNTFTPSGSVGGTAITKAQLPIYNLTVTDPGHTHTYNNTSWGASKTWDVTKSNYAVTSMSNTSTASGTGYTGITVSSGGSGETHTHTFTGEESSVSTLQPYLVCNYIIRVK